MKEDKQAYLVIAHNQFELLKKLIKKIDYEGNDIYLHLDKRFKEANMDELKKCVRFSNLYFMDRRKIGWGGYSFIKLTVDMLEKANKNMKYNYYHLISGVDFPLKSPEEIYSFFNKDNKIEYVSFDSQEYDKKYDNRIKYYWLLQEYEKDNKILRIINRVLVNIQKILKINRIKNINFDLQKGSNWFTINNDLTEYVINKKEWIKKYFKFSHCSDEIFLQTIIENSEFRKKVYQGGINDGNLRLIDWERGNPYIWRIEDKELLLNPGINMWARKFDFSVDSEIINILKKKEVEK